MAPDTIQRAPRGGLDLGADLRLHDRAIEALERRSHRSMARRRLRTRSSSSSTTRPSCWPSAGDAGPTSRIVANTRETGPLGRPKHAASPPARETSSPSSTTTPSPPPTGSSRLAAAYRDPDGAWRRRRRPARAGSRAGPAGSRLSSTGSSAAPTRGCRRSRPTVRNLVGANMSFRREALVEVGGFRHELGRVGTIPAGCEETDLCIRIRQRWPKGRILYDPAAVVDHLVPAGRGERCATSARRCRGEGRSKAVLAGLVGSAVGPRGRALLHPADSAARRPARDRRGAAAATRAAWRGRRRSSPGWPTTAWATSRRRPSDVASRDGAEMPKARRTTVALSGS